VAEQSRPVRVHTGALTGPDWALQGVAIVFGVLLFAILIAPGVGLPPDTLGVRVVMIVAYVVVLECAFLGLTFVRCIDLDSRGVTFRFPFYRKYVLWADLEPWDHPAEGGAWWVTAPRKGLTVASNRRSYRLTLEQARAVMRFPARPHWELSSEVYGSLGLPRDAA
jgi:hypothetical protein